MLLTDPMPFVPASERLEGLVPNAVRRPARVWRWHSVLLSLRPGARGFDL